MQQVVESIYQRFLENPVIVTDSRKITPGCLFFGLKGEKVDGSVFGNTAVSEGASIAIVRHGSCQPGKNIVFVEDPLARLQELARMHRDLLNIPILAITGSNGKTTTKELITRALSSQYQLTATQGNLNNHIGVPLTILRIKGSDQMAIIEMGANHIGEIAMLCSIARPSHGIITNIGKAHLEGFGGIEGVKRAKSELYRWLEKSHGTAIVNRDEQYLMELARSVPTRVLYGFGTHPSYKEGDYTFVSKESMGSSTVEFATPDGNVEARSNMFGSFNAANIATAIAAGLLFNVDGKNISEAIASYVPDNNRAQYVTRGSNVFVMDAYNANPTSMHSAISSFVQIDHPKKYLVLGSMMELGEYAGEEHLNIADYVSGLHGISTILVGSLFEESARRFGLQWYADVETLQQQFSSETLKDAMILVKGSRGMHLEDLLRAFQ
jgi:UDP-N-acetylmuramoyl-tripeptide--D-alanyl-D-alanine ligase